MREIGGEKGLLNSWVFPQRMPHGDHSVKCTLMNSVTFGIIQAKGRKLFPLRLLFSSVWWAWGFFTHLCCPHILWKTMPMKFSWPDHPLCRKGPQNISRREDWEDRVNTCHGCGHPASISSRASGLLWEVTQLWVILLSPKFRCPHTATSGYVI